MPIYEFFCEACNTIFNFYSKRIDTTTSPLCPKCRNTILSRKVSPFAVTGKAKESDDMDELPFDESKMEQAMSMLAGEADKIREDDPRQAAQLMRKLTDMTGIGLGAGMEEALRRMEQGEDPEQIEAEMGDLIEAEEPFILPEKKAGKGGSGVRRPQTDPVLYDLHPEV
ncbi:FmdB family zinc ribbon protein [Desulfatirhabdium butyrativorans]|uniref:FmdB family zinc ribbon protein n=1 Tax=Desulfatirhabdium butyrativorans TaxID=340467 RepID=UPI0004244F7F|nr:FmdB family zinc ribbon protein [Desulfatirhabdium butyrativorans]